MPPARGRCTVVTSRPHPPNGLDVSVRITADHVVLGVRGVVDHATGPDVGALLDALAGLSRPSAVVVDLAECNFVDSSGLRAITGRAGYLAAHGIALSLESPSPQARHLAWTMGVGTLIDQVQPVTQGPQVPARASGAPVDLAGYLQAQIGVTHELVDAALRLVVVVAGQTVPGSDGASVTLRRRGLLGTVAATDRTVADMDAAQYASGEGPCIDAALTGDPFHTGSLDQEQRWPAFAPVAQGLGIEAILSSPLRAQGQQCGALNLYSRRANVFTDDGRALAARIADEASRMLTVAVTGPGDDQMWGQFVEALGARESIARAEGMLMEREGIGGLDAFAMLRRSSMWSGMPLRDRAEDMVVAARRGPPGMGSRNHGPRA